MAKRAVKVAVIQDGARLHYVVPVALKNFDALDRVFCDWYSPPGSTGRIFARLARLYNRDLSHRMLDRYEPQLDGARILTYLALALDVKRGPKGFPTHSAYMNWLNAKQARWILRKGFGGATGLFGFIRQVAPEVFKCARERGVVTVGDQMIAPYAWEQQEEEKQQGKFPEFIAGSAKSRDPGWSELEKRTWGVLDRITCASEYVRSGLMAQGIPSEKITVNPYPVDTHHFNFVDRSGRTNEPLRVGFVGSVNLRKGAPLFMQVAKRFDPQRVKFVMVGPIAINPEAVTKHGGDVELAGNVPRSQIPRWLEKFDVYFFPSTCEGSAGSVTEAMASGLPVVTSPNSGSIVRDGESGFIHAYDAVDAYAESIEKLARDKSLRLEMGKKARESVELMSVERYGKVLVQVFERELAETKN